VDNLEPEEKEYAWYSALKPSWYIEQMKGWTAASYSLLFLGIGIILGMTVAQPITRVALLTLAAGVLGFTTTVATTNARPVNGMFGLISAIIYIIVAVGAKNYNDVVLQATYIILLDIPILLLPSWAKDVDKKVRFLAEEGKGIRNWILTGIFFIAVFGILYYSDTHIFISPRPITDSLAAAIGITGAMLTTLRFSESYICWTIQGIMSVVLWGITAFQGDANWVLFVTYLMYLANDGISFLDKGTPWFHHQKHEKVA
jgi:nicotinamide mononucleotide transporter